MRNNGVYKLFVCETKDKELPTPRKPEWEYYLHVGDTLQLIPHGEVNSDISHYALSYILYRFFGGTTNGDVTGGWTWRVTEIENGA